METRITIVIPVYNAFDELKECVSSIKRHTDLAAVELLFVNDCSPDERIVPFLDAMECENVHVHHNERNYGFSHNVNYGFAAAGVGDVILLNTDTVVTKGWIEKLNRCAYSDPSIGTVTPFSNSATICSLPVFCQDNKLPEGFTIDEYASVVEKCSMHKYPEIPVAVGFCMYIKREVIDAIGVFDEETYQRGYGEENDFCNRAQLAGYRNVLCDDTFVFHSGSASFVAKDKEKLMADHQKILEERFPLMCREIDMFIPANPLKELQQNVNFWAKLVNGRQNILYMIHADFRENSANNVGGTQLHVKDLVDCLRFEKNVFVLARDREYLNLTIYIDRQELFLRYYVGAARRRPSYHEPEIAKVIARILDTFRIDVVHIHHLQGLSADIFQIAHERKIPLFATLHDFFMICPSITMINQDDDLCIGQTSTDVCRECLFAQKRYPERVPKEIDFVGAWRQSYGNGMQLCDRVFAPSNSAREVFESYYPQLKGRITVIPHGTDNTNDVYEECNGELEYYLDTFGVRDGQIILNGWMVLKGEESQRLTPFVEVEGNRHFRFDMKKEMRSDVAQTYGDNKYSLSGFWGRIPEYALKDSIKLYIGLHDEKRMWRKEIKELMPQRRLKRKDRYRVAFVGGMCFEKGSKIAYEMITKKKDQIDWYIIGGIGDRDLQFLNQKNCYKTGWYQRKDIGSIISSLEIDLICIPAVCSETFGYVLSEAIESNVPVLAADIGALGERIREYDCGWLVPYGSKGEVYLQKIEEIRANKSEYTQKKYNAERINMLSVKQMAEKYDEVYQTFGKTDREYTFDSEFVLTGLAWAGGGIGDAQMMQRLIQLERELNMIRSTHGYKALEIIRKMNIPFKKEIKAVMYKGYKAIVQKR